MSMQRVAVNPEIIRWARERSGTDESPLIAKFAKLRAWENAEIQPTMRQAEAFARAVHVPVAYLFLDNPPGDTLPVNDFRTVGGKGVSRPSPDLIDTFDLCYGRQCWYRDFAEETGQERIPFVNSVSVDSDPRQVANQIRDTVGFGLEARGDCRTWEDALRRFIRGVEHAGVLVMVSGIVGSNTHRKLDPEEFRGFALADPYAPLIFVNGSDAKSARIFTLTHELAHIWLGTSGVSSAGVVPLSGHRPEEVWCNAVAAHVLVPGEALGQFIDEAKPLEELLSRLARTFKVSQAVILRRLSDEGFITRARFEREFRQSMAGRATRSGGGGNFYASTLSRVGRRFARALIDSTLEGKALYRDAFQMLGVTSADMLHKLRRELDQPA